MGCVGTMASVGTYVEARAVVVQTTTAFTASEIHYPESLAQTHTGSSNRHQLHPPCGSWGLLGKCEDGGHEIVHELICNREWCERCGGKDGAAHQRRKANWYPKLRQLQTIGRFVITLPPEIREGYRTRAALGKLGIAFKRLMQRRGYDRGLRRWHFFGEDHKDSASGGEAPRFHPHLEIMVEAAHLPEGELESIKASVGSILGVGIDRVNVHYQYAKARDVGKKCHFLSYALRPTFTDAAWDEELAYEIIGLKNALPWGVWDGEPVWDVPVGHHEAPSPALVAIGAGFCPHDGSRIQWAAGVHDLRELVHPDYWIKIDGGYWLRALGRSPPEHPPGPALTSG